MGAKARCPVCEQIFDLEEGAQIGDIVTCPDCYTELLIKRLDPADLEEIDSPWDDYDDQLHEDQDRKPNKGEWS